MDGADRTMNPTVSNGVFSFVELQPGQQVSLQANQTYPDAINGYVNPTGYIYKNVNTIDVALEQFLAGEVNLLDNQVGVPAQNYADLRARTESGEIQTYEELNNGYSWLAFNLSDPKNPVNGTDEDGNIVEQPPHPIFGDVRVRKALAQAADLDAVIQGVLFGEAVRATSPSIPTSWAYNPDLPAVAYDPAAAAALLEEAGWIDEDGDGIREAHGAMYVADGTPLTFTLIVSASESEQVATAQILQDQFKAVGANAEVQAIDFNTAVQQLVGQVFDTALLGWSLTYPDDPDFSFAFNPENDVVGGGFNFVSYNNPEVSDLLDQANNLPGCDPAERAALYQQAQEKLVDDQPYIFMTTKKNMIAAAGNIEGFGPYPNQMFWNVDTWAIAGGG
jgi:peptide/nickel transport system substrate-binding protein